MTMNDRTLEYYDEQFKGFVEDTLNVDFTGTQNKFINRLESGSHILDFGCGSGRDTKYFLDQGFQVTAIDASVELCKFASEFTGIKVKRMFFQELSEIEAYDGIWACSSILHLPYDELQDVFLKMVVALKYKGIIYTSFKYGTFEGERNGRYFTDMNEEKFNKFLEQFQDIKVEEFWVTGDVRPGRGDEKWLNLILRKA
ncbi:MAG: class I SAM-dependent methyltransferase [Phascolarctobacterium sp.]|nr:class I SAM-dependent methyltransferase [Phascolarctobacterium sp.]